MLGCHPGSFSRLICISGESMMSFTNAFPGCVSETLAWCMALMPLNSVRLKKGNKVVRLVVNACWHNNAHLVHLQHVHGSLLLTLPPL